MHFISNVLIGQLWDRNRVVIVLIYEGFFKIRVWKKLDN